MFFELRQRERTLGDENYSYLVICSRIAIIARIKTELLNRRIIDGPFSKQGFTIEKKA